MRRLLTLCLLFLFATMAGAQDSNRFYPGQFVPFSTGFLAPGPILLPDGTAAAPSLAFASEPTYGWYKPTASVLALRYSASDRIAYYGGRNSFQLAMVVNLGWCSGTAGCTEDLILSRAAAATLQLGAADAAAPVNQTLQAQGVAAGTSDVAGGSYTIRPGVGRGSAVPAPLVLNRSIVTTTGNAAQAQASAFVICGTKTLGTTSAVASVVATISTTTLTSGGLTMFYNVSATSAGAADAATGAAHISWNNVGGTVNSTMSTVINEVQSNSSGTLAATPTVTVGTNIVSIKLTPTWVTIVPTAVRAAITIFNQGIDPVVCQ